MSIKNMHYDFKMKLNKVDSQKYRNFKPQQIDWILHEAYGIFIKTIAQPRLGSALGFETNSRTINDIRSLVVENKEVTPVEFNSTSLKAVLPEDYWFLVSSYALGKKGDCEDVIQTRLVQHDDRHEVSPFDKSSFEWRESNYRFYNEGLRFFTDGTFTLNKVYLDYIKTPKYIHFADAVAGGTYKLPSGVVLTGYQNPEVSPTLHSEIVDIAVLITTGTLQIPDYQVKMAKLNLNN